MKSSRRALNSALLSLLVAVGCSEHPTAPSEPRALVANAGHSLNQVASAATEHACTFGAGYWKTHTDAWPSRFDPAAAFYDSGQSWIEVLRTPPRGDAYYVLGHQFIAAALNLDGMDPGLVPSEVGTPFSIAGPGFFTAGGHTELTRTELIRLAAVLEYFNEGNAGVPACR